MAFDEPDTVEHHCFDDLSMGKMVVADSERGVIGHIGNLKGIEGTSDNAEMTDKGLMRRRNHR